MIHPLAKAILNVLAELDEDTLRDCYVILRTERPHPLTGEVPTSAPLDAAIYAWIDAGRPMDVTSEPEPGPAPKTTQHIRRLPHGPDGPAGPVLCGSPEGLTQYVYPFESSDANCPECLRLVTDVPIDERI